jgi:SNF family Na+-dependent transporter
MNGRKFIEWSNLILFPITFVLLVMIIIKTSTLSGASDGLLDVLKGDSDYDHFKKIG